MTKAELKQKLEAVKDVLAVRPKAGHEGTTRYYSEEFIEGFDSLLPLLLDAYEALELALSFCPKGPVPEGLSPEFYHTLDYLEELKLQEHINESRATLARIEAFANGEEK